MGKVLIDKGHANVDFIVKSRIKDQISRWKTEYQEQTALHIAIVDNYTSFVELLISRNVDVNMKKKLVVENIHSDDDSKIKYEKIPLQTPLMLATKMGNLQIMDMLITANANINDCDYDGNTALMIAVEQHRTMNTPTVKKLIEAGADTTIMNRFGDTVYSLVDSNVHRSQFGHVMQTRREQPHGMSKLSRHGRSRGKGADDYGYDRHTQSHSRQRNTNDRISRNVYVSQPKKQSRVRLHYVD